MFKPTTYTLSVIAAAVLILGLSAPGFAYHDGGVAHCDGCHTMHNSVNGSPVVTPAGSNLLIASDASSVCLDCHAGSGSFRVYSDNGSNYTAGGDFFWTSVDIEWQSRGTQTRKGYGNGHSIVAADFPEIQTEIDLTSSPGGNFPAAILGCQSCHDPHGVVPNKVGPISGSGSFGDTAPAGTTLGNYRLLGAVGYSPTNSGVTFVNAPPVARATPNNDNTETDANHAEYGSGTSEWCANCHAGFQVAGTGLDKHPTGNTVKLGDFVSNYNTYRATGETGAGSGVTFANAYFALVPVERGINDSTLLNTKSTEGAVDGQSNVTCLSCHRAHASAFEYGTRWDTSEEFLVDSHPQPTDTVTRSDAATLTTNSYYGRTIETAFNEFQRSLCNKCHLKD